MNKISITKSRAGHYTLTVRNERGGIVLQDKFATLEAARSARAAIAKSTT